MQRNKGAHKMGVAMMILAFMILACQGVSRLNPFATATPTPTLTFTPTITPSPTPTFTPTFTPTATPPPTGRAKEGLSNGTTLFIDYDGNYQVTFPKGWTVVILEKDEIEDALNSIPEQEKNVSDMIESIKSTDVKELIRVAGFNFKAQQGVYTPNVNISYDTNPLLAAISLEDLISATVSFFPSLKIEVVNTEVTKTDSGIDIGVIEARWSMKLLAGSQKVNVEQKQVFFKSGKGVVVITFSTVKNATVDLSSDLEKLIESIRFLD